MNLYFHGGKCCAVKTIAGFTFGKPDDKWNYCCAESKGLVRNNDSNGYDVSTQKPFFTDDAPQESYEARLERLIKFCKRRRPQGVIEVVLAGSPTSPSYNQWDYWEPILTEHGFKLSVGPFVNSNTTWLIKIYHLVYDAKAEKAATVVPNPFGRSV